MSKTLGDHPEKFKEYHDQSTTREKALMLGVGTSLSLACTL